MSQINCAIVVPTKNRFNFIDRLLKFYYYSNSKPSIYLGDSSDNKISLLIQEKIFKFKNNSQE